MSEPQLGDLAQAAGRGSSRSSAAIASRCARAAPPSLAQVGAVEVGDAVGALARAGDHRGLLEREHRVVGARSAPAGRGWPPSTWRRRRRGTRRRATRQRDPLRRRRSATTTSAASASRAADLEVAGGPRARHRARGDEARRAGRLARQHGAGDDRRGGSASGSSAAESTPISCMQLEAVAALDAHERRGCGARSAAPGTTRSARRRPASGRARRRAGPRPGRPVSTAHRQAVRAHLERAGVRG